jgi:hypothetical protein
MRFSLELEPISELQLELYAHVYLSVSGPNAVIYKIFAE